MFIVPWPWAGAGVAPASAARTRSATRLEVSTLPAATAAGGARVEQRSPAARATSTGRCAPADGGASGSVSTRTAKNAADLVTASGQLRLPSTCVGAAGEVEPQRVAGDRRRHPQLDVGVAVRPALEHVGGLVVAVGELGDRAPGVRRSA